MLVANSHIVGRFVGTYFLWAALGLALDLGCSSSSKTTVDSGIKDDGDVDSAGGDAQATDADAAGPITEIRCSDEAKGMLEPGERVTAEGGQVAHLSGAAVAAPSNAKKSVELTISCSDKDLAPEGFIGLGPTVSFSPAGELYGVDLRFTLPYLKGRLPAGAGEKDLVVWLERKSGTKTNLPLVNPVFASIGGGDAFGTLSFELDELASFQVAVSKDAGKDEDVKRDYTYRALVGFSMGGGAAAVIGMRNPDRFDFLGPLGAEPGIEMQYFLRLIEQGLLGGFCTAADEAAGKGKIGELCPIKREALVRQYENLATYEKMLYQPGQGVGLTLARDTYTQALRDLVHAYGNAAYHNPDDPYLPPGVPASFLEREADACGDPVKLSGFYDRNFNPDGSSTVITFCDGKDSSQAGLGVFDPTLQQTEPIQVLLAVDLNDNGKRDSGEPVLIQSNEPFEDVGVDGKADADEPGYDAATNPDPSGDNYHYLKNPTGAEGNWRYDAGEPFEDVGVDGVASTCQAGEGPSCYDYGEGNATFDMVPMARRWLDHDPAANFIKLPAEQQQRLDVWVDSGIRDFLNAHVASNQFIGQLATSGAPVRIFDSFERLNGPETARFDFNTVDWAGLGKHVYVRYGDPSLSEEVVEKTGDGRHVGTALQLTHRTVSFFSFVEKRWPDGDRSLENADVQSANFMDDQEFLSPSTGQMRPFGIFVPPGYFHPANKDKRYPVVYFTHGYGMDPQDLVAASGLFANYMVSPNLPEEQRFQKFLIVYVDGRCRPGGSRPLPPGGDGCERGTYYIDSPDPDSTAQMETLMLELMDHVDANFRTK